MLLTDREREREREGGGSSLYNLYLIPRILSLGYRSMFQSLKWQEKRDEKSSRKEEGRDSSYRPRIDLWTLPRHQEAKSVSPVSFLFPFAGQRPISFFLHPVCLSDSTVSSLTGSLDAAQMRPQLPLFRRSLSELAAPSKSYHTLSGISINASALIARSSPYYRRATPVLTQLLRNLSLSSLLPPSIIRRPSQSVWGRSTHFWKTEIDDLDNENDLSIVLCTR